MGERMKTSRPILEKLYEQGRYRLLYDTQGWERIGSAERELCRNLIAKLESNKFINDGDMQLVEKDIRDYFGQEGA